VILSGVTVLWRKVNEWNISAAAAVSLKDANAQLSALIVRWRKLELESWGSFLEDEEQNENVALDPQRRTLLMRHLAESKKDADLMRMIHEVNNPGQVATAVGAGAAREA